MCDATNLFVVVVCVVVCGDILDTVVVVVVIVIRVLLLWVLLMMLSVLCLCCCCLGCCCCAWHDHNNISCSVLLYMYVGWCCSYTRACICMHCPITESLTVVVHCDVVVCQVADCVYD